MGADKEVVRVHGCDGVAQHARDLGSVVAVGVDRVEGMNQLKTSLEDLLGQGGQGRGFRGGELLAEVLQVLAEVEDVEVRLVLTRAEQVWPQAGSTAEHLPELGL